MSKLQELIREYCRRGEMRSKLERKGGPVDQLLHEPTKVVEGPPGRYLDIRDPADLFAVLSPPFVDIEVRISDDSTRVVNSGALLLKLAEVAPFVVRELADLYAPLEEEQD